MILAACLAVQSEVVDRYGLQLLRTSPLILRNEALAEDAIQETFLKAWQRIGSLRDEEPGPWLTRIAMNESISTYRRRHRSRHSPSASAASAEANARCRVRCGSI